MRKGRKALLEDLLPRLRIELAHEDVGTNRPNPVMGGLDPAIHDLGEDVDARNESGHDERGGGRLDPSALFDRPVGDIRLEIGFGAGEHLAARAKERPDIGFIGAEHYLAGIAGLLKHIADDGLENIRIFQDDAAVLLDALPDAALGRVYLLYPDPWPKARHEKRRFLSHENLDRLHRVMKPGAELLVATDHPVYLAWAVERMASRKDFAWLAEGPKDWREPPAHWPGTRYEAKAIREGRKPTYLAYRRI